MSQRLKIALEPVMSASYVKLLITKEDIQTHFQGSDSNSIRAERMQPKPRFRSWTVTLTHAVRLGSLPEIFGTEEPRGFLIHLFMFADAFH